HLDRALQIQREAGVLHRNLRRRGVGVVLAPLLVAFLVSDPHAILAVTGDVRPRLESGRRRDGNRLRILAGDRDQQDVVVALVVRVVHDVDVPLRVRGDGRAPVVGLAAGDDTWGAPRVTFRQGRENDLEVILAPALPRQPDDAAGIGRGHDVEIRAGRIGEPRRLRPFTFGTGPARRGVAAMEDLPVAVDLLT